MYLLRKGAYRDISHIILKHTQWATSWYQKYLHRRKGGKVMTAKNMCSNFCSKWCSPPLKHVHFFGIHGKWKWSQLTHFILVELICKNLAFFRPKVDAHIGGIILLSLCAQLLAAPWMLRRFFWCYNFGNQIKGDRNRCFSIHSNAALNITTADSHTNAVAFDIELTKVDRPFLNTADLPLDCSGSRHWHSRRNTWLGMDLQLTFIQFLLSV